MQLSPVEIPRTGAREKAAGYRRLERHEPDPERKAEYGQFARAYEAAAKEDQPLISLSKTIAAGGSVVRTLVSHPYDRERQERVEQRSNYLLPRLAVIRASSRYVYTLGVESDGAVDFCDRLSPSETLVKGRTRVEAGFELPDGFTAGDPLTRWGASRAWAAMVPICPPEHRPAGTSTLASFQVLFEVDEWQWQGRPEPPGDPALLKHVGGDIYAVVATWDLSELEQLVLSGRRP